MKKAVPSKRGRECYRVIAMTGEGGSGERGALGGHSN